MGGPFAGVGVTGYDNHSKKFVLTWMDSMSTGIYFFEGSGSADGKSFTQEGHYNDAVQGPMKWRAVTKLVDDNTLSNSAVENCSVVIQGILLRTDPSFWGPDPESSLFNPAKGGTGVTR